MLYSFGEGSCSSFLSPVSVPSPVLGSFAAASMRLPAREEESTASGSSFGAWDSTCVEVPAVSPSSA